jgi:hypothetical protein
MTKSISRITATGVAALEAHLLALGPIGCCLLHPGKSHRSRSKLFAVFCGALSDCQETFAEQNFPRSNSRDSLALSTGIR